MINVPLVELFSYIDAITELFFLIEAIAYKALQSFQVDCKTVGFVFLKIGFARWASHAL